VTNPNEFPSEKLQSLNQAVSRGRVGLCKVSTSLGVFVGFIGLFQWAATSDLYLYAKQTQCTHWAKLQTHYFLRS